MTLTTLALSITMLSVSLSPEGNEQSICQNTILNNDCSEVLDWEDMVPLLGHEPGQQWESDEIRRSSGDDKEKRNAP